MKIKFITLLCLSLFAYSAATAQVVTTSATTEETYEEEDEYNDEDDDDSSFVSETTTDSLPTLGGVAVPPAMDASVDSLLRNWHAQQYLTEDAQSTTTDNGLADAATYTERLRKIPAVMELSYNPIVHKFIEQYAAKRQRSVSYMLGAGNFYMPIIEEALEAYGVPLELKYLPVIESSFNPTAVSKAGATGLWQFMLTTGKRYDLMVNSLVDDRCDPVKASWAAAHYLHDLYKIYGDWTLVIAAYNCGPGNVNKAIHRADGVKDYWQIYPYLPSETRGYVPAFIAANYIMNYYCEHGIKPMEAQLPLATDTVIVSRDLHLQQVADLCNLPLEQIRALNPQYRKDVVPGYWRPCSLRLPQESLMTFIDYGDSIYNHRAAELLPRRSVTAVNEVTTITTTTMKATAKSSYSGRRGKYAMTSKNSKRGKKYSSYRKNSSYSKRKGNSRRRR